LTGDQLKNKIDKNLGIIEASKTNNYSNRIKYHNQIILPRVSD